MKKAILMARVDYHLELQVRELSELLGVSKSTVVRMLCKKTIEEMQDENGNWLLPHRADKGEDANKASIRKDDGGTVKQLQTASKRTVNS